MKVFGRLFVVILMMTAVFGDALMAEAPAVPTRKNAHNFFLEGGWAAILATRHRFKIVYDDEVTGGCLPRPSRLRDKLELSLRRNNFEIVPSDEKGIYDELRLSALGFKAGTGFCAVSLVLSLGTWAPVTVPYAKGNPTGDITMVPLRYEVGHYLVTWRKRGMQRKLEKTAVDLGDKLFLQVARSRDRIFRDFPVIEQNYKAALRAGK